MAEQWIRETTELINELQSQDARLEARIREAEQQRKQIQARLDGAYSLLQMYRDRHHISPLDMENVAPEQFKGKSYMQAMIEMAHQHGGYLKVKDAVEIMLKAQFGSDKRAIRAGIYTRLQQDKGKRFEKVSPGNYRLTNGSRAGIEQQRLSEESDE